MKCVDMNTNTIVLGYGCVAVKACMNYIQFSEIRPPAEIGSPLITKDGDKVGDWEYTGNRITIAFKNMNEVLSFSESLKAIEDSCSGSFEFKGIKFDFSEYKQGSIEVIKIKIEYIKRALLMAIAC